MFLYGESAIPSQQDYEFMGIPHDERGAMTIEELGDYTHIVAEKRSQLLRSGDVEVFAANGLMRTIAGLSRPTEHTPQVLPFMTRWQQMGEEEPFSPA